MVVRCLFVLGISLATWSLAGCGGGSSNAAASAPASTTPPPIQVAPTLSLTNVAQDTAPSGIAFHFSVGASGGSEPSVGPIPWVVSIGGSLITSGSIASITMGQTSLVTVSNPAGHGSETYDITIDPNGTIPRANVAPVTASLTTASDTPPNQVDLFVNGPHYHGMYYFGDPIMHFSVHNYSASNTDAKYVHVIVTDNDTQVWSTVIPTLPANTEIQFDDRHLPNVLLGTHHTFRIIVDPDHYIQETNPANTNNQYRMEVDVPVERAYPAAEMRPNLTWQDPHFHTPFPTTGGTMIPWHFMIWNHSTGTTTAGGTWELRRADGTLVASDVIPAMEPLSALPSGGAPSTQLYDHQVNVLEPFITGSVQYTLSILPTDPNEGDMGNKVVRYTVLMTQGTGG